MNALHSRVIKEADKEEFLYDIIFLPLTIFLDIILLFIQPIIYLEYRKWVEENEWRNKRNIRLFKRFY